MKKILSIVALALLFNSCQQDIQTNTPAFQAKLNDKQWRANQSHVSINAGGGITITAYTKLETVVLKTNSAARGKYVLGTTNFAANNASYSAATAYNTRVIEGSAYDLSAVTVGGTGYADNFTGAHTSGGTGSGLRVATQATNGIVKTIKVVSRGIGYKAGDEITILGGNNNAKFKIVNVQQSNGEILIEEVKDGLYTGKFRFNAVNAAGDVVTFSEGVFYKVALQ